ncbi:MAG: alpha-N-acetylglucosaminidase [Bacteroidales bacterium]|nr:alpha-N-acetylglucosaminidase [Bacteroidales bacterium]
MKHLKGILPLALVLCSVVTGQSQVRPVEALCHRVLGDADTNFIFAQKNDTLDFFAIEQAGTKIRITGNNDNSMAMGLNHYLRHCVGVHVSWFEREPVALPQVLPPVQAPVRKTALVKERFFLNYCTYGYTMPWWQWHQWERFIDWMALNGITMPLAITGQEAVWYEVWKEFGLTDEEIRGYFSGPAHLPWHRMANLDGFGGPLPMSWLTSQKELQKRILARERELNMTPVLPAFAGHVPEQLTVKYPNADIKQLSAWCGFEPTYFLNSTDPLFARIQKSFMEKEMSMFGTDHIYGVDPFNEMDPPHWQPEYLSDVAENIYYSLRDVDPEARWLQMTWVFYYKRKSWTPERLRAYLTAVPNNKLVLLDYFCENTEVWRSTEGFYQQPYIWCYLGNFGGNTMLVGNINELDKKLSSALEEAGPNMLGVGSTLESFDVSPQIYEYLFDRAWNPALTTDAWIADWARRVGTDDYIYTWQMLNDSVYKDWSFYGLGTQLVARPTLEGHGTYYTKPYYSYSNDSLKAACKSLIVLHLKDLSKESVEESKALRSNPNYQYDLVNFYSQWLGNYFMDVRNDFTQAYKQKDIPEMKRQVKRANEVFEDVDRLLSTHPSFMLGPWISDARALGINGKERNYYERQARTILTIWGGPVLNDYANRLWGGLVKDYYAKRWNLFFKAVLDDVKNGREFDAQAFDQKLSEFEQKWPQMHGRYPSVPQGDTYGVASEIFQKYLQE